MSLCNMLVLIKDSYRVLWNTTGRKIHPVRIGNRSGFILRILEVSTKEFVFVSISVNRLCRIHLERVVDG